MSRNFGPEKKMAGSGNEEILMKRMGKLGVIFAALVLCLGIVGCGGGNTTAAQPEVSIAIIPAAITVPQGGSQTFFATVQGSGNTAVTWTVQEGAAGGTITSAGLYTAPSAPGVYHVIATSQADSTRSAMASVTVPPIAVAISPNTATVIKGESAPFTAMVTGTNNTAVTWSVQQGAAGGLITSAGVYTAPQTIGIYFVVATSQADNTKSAIATVNVINVPAISISITPAMDTLGPSGKRTFVGVVEGTIITAAGVVVGGTINTGVTWSVLEGATGGAIDANGGYIAPTAQGTFHVIATSAADSTITASASVTIVPAGFIPTGSMAEARSDHTATLLQDGRVLVVGGLDGNGRPLGTAELYDPSTGTFSSTGSMAAKRADHTSTLLPNGKVLVTGGSTENAGVFNPTASSAELYDPETGTFTPTGDMTAGRVGHTATLLPTGKVLLIGGVSFGVGELASAELYDPATGTFAATGSLSYARESHSATLLQDGTVLVAGGDNVESVLSTAELYDPATGLFTSTSNQMNVGRAGHTATLLPSGIVQLAEGLMPSVTTLTSSLA